MKKYKNCLVILVCIGLFLLKPIYASDSLFSVYYGDTSWAAERGELDHLYITLEKNSDYIGYIGYYVAEDDYLEYVKCRLKRAKKHLTKFRKLPKKRLVFVYLGKTEKTKIILQPVPKKLGSPFKGFKK